MIAALVLLAHGSDAASRKPPHTPAAAAKTVKRSPAQSRAVVQKVLVEIGDLLWTHGDYYWHEGRYEDQAALCRLITRIDPTFAEAYSSGGWLLENLGRNDDALAVYLEGARAVPNDWRPLHDLGYFYYQQKRYREALEVLERAVKFRPPSFVWHILAHAYDKSGQRDQAVTTWRKCLELFPDDGAAQHNLRRLVPPIEEDAATGAEAN